MHPGASGESLKEIADEAAQAAEREAISRTLKATGGNKSQAAEVLKTDYKTLHRKMKRLSIRARDFMPE
jgi:DNA-binding NtrC family response regulator